jgi:uncharacterized protein involved in response to NO
MKENEPRPSPQWRAFLDLGFRPLYLGGCAWAALSVALWIGAPHWLRGTLAGVAWHAHEMLWGFIAAIAVGFLFTAGANWSGVNPLHGRSLGVLCLLWLAARAGFLLPGQSWFLFAAACELAFFAWAALALARALARARNRRNYGVPFLLAALGAADALYLAAAPQAGYAILMQRFTVGMACMALVALLIARRVIPFFAMRAVPGLEIPMHTRSGQWQLGAAGLAAVSALLGLDAVMAASLAAAGAIALVQLVAWKPPAVPGQPLLWILYAGYAGLAAGLLVAAAHAAGWSVRLAWPAHVIGMAGFSVLIIGMVTRTALGHLGQPLRADRLVVACYALVITAAGLRLLALLPTAFALSLLRASAAAWVLAFALYLWRFAPMLVRPRAGP